MLLNTINGPEDLRGLDPGQLRALAREIRAFLVESLAATGGHLGSNLGAVELTLALHRVFESPRDTIVWDTGHQAYVHKLVTGRRDAFARLRQAGGLSGYPSREESDHDIVENSHASTALSYAFGLAAARDARGDDGTVVAVVGDGALTGGMAYEALSNLGYRGMRVVVVVNDNGRSYAPTISRLAVGGSGPDRLPSQNGGASRSNGASGAFFEALGFQYVGPIDGHDVVSVENALRAAATADGPVVLHTLTVKGLGFSPAERDDEKCLHDTSAFDPKTGAPRSKPSSSYTEAFTAALCDAAARRPEIVAITAAMPGSTGLLSFRQRYPDRFFDVGIAEQHAVTAAAGMAMRGLRPVVAIYSTFLSRAWDQLYYDVGLHQLPVVFCIDRAGITGDDGPSHHGVLDLVLLTKVPGITVFAPSSYEELGVMLEDALAITDGPVAIRWPKTPARRVSTTGSGLRARCLRTGSDVCILAVGKLVEAAESAADALAEQGFTATVWDVRVATPLDPHMITEARAHRVVVTVEDGVAEGGVGSLVLGALARLDGGAPMPTVITLGTPLAYIPHAKPDAILASLGLDAAGIAAAAFKAIESTTPGP